MWTAWYDGEDTPFMEGTQDEVLATVKATPQQLFPYAENPDGDQFAWNPHTNSWDAL